MLWFVPARSLDITGAVYSLTLVAGGALEVGVLADALVLHHHAQGGGRAVVGSDDRGQVGLSSVEIVNDCLSVFGRG